MDTVPHDNLSNKEIQNANLIVALEEKSGDHKSDLASSSVLSFKAIHSTGVELLILLGTKVKPYLKIDYICNYRNNNIVS